MATCNALTRRQVAKRTRRLVAMLPAFLAATVMSTASPVIATPARFTHVQQTLLGADATHYYYLESVHRYPGSYYDHSETLRLCCRRKSDGAHVDSITVSQVEHHLDPNTGVARPPAVSALPPFDLAAYLRQRIVHLPTPVELDSVAIDSLGIYFLAPAKRVYFIRSEALLRQLPETVKSYAPVIRSVYRVHESWNRTGRGDPAVEDWFFVVDVGHPQNEMTWRRLMIYAPRPVRGASPR